MSATEYKVREYPLEIECFAGEHWSKGWQPQDVFADAVERCCGERPSEEAIEYEVWKWVPAHEDEFTGYYWLSTLGKPGAFPVTVVGR